MKFFALGKPRRAPQFPHRNARSRAAAAGLFLVLAALAALFPAGWQRANAQGLRLPAASAAQDETLRLGPRPEPAAPPAVPAAAQPQASTPALAPADSAGVARPADFIVAVVNSEPVTNNELRARVERARAQITRQGGAPPAPDALARELLERLILERLLLQQAREAGIRIDELALTQAEQNLARQNGMSPEQLRARLASEGLAPERLRAELRNQLLEQRLRERQLQTQTGVKTTVTEREVDQYLRDAQRQAQAEPAEINLGHVLVLVPEDAAPALVQERQARAQQAADRLRAGAELAAVAREFSDAAEGAHGGMLGLRPVGRYPELFVDATKGLEPGAIVGPLRSPAGFHVLTVIERSQGGPATMQQNHARHILLRTGPQLSADAAAARLADYRRRLLAGQADFAALARAHSQDEGSARDGGDLGWAGPGRYVPEFEQALDALQPGELSEPLATRFGLHLIELLERRQVQPSAREQRESARNALREKKLDQAWSAWLQELRARAFVEYRDAPR